VEISDSAIINCSYELCVKWPINPKANPYPAYSHTPLSRDYILEKLRVVILQNIEINAGDVSKGCKKIVSRLECYATQGLLKCQEIIMYEGDAKNYFQAVDNTVTPSDPSRAFPQRTYMLHVSD
jgi:hypothetical protein